MNRLKAFYEKYKHGLPLLTYMILYLLWFRYLEKTVTTQYRVIHMTLDDHIPFCELFVIPYFLWFIYVSVTVLFFFFQDKDDYYRTCIFLFTGMTVFLVISTLWPNGHHLRPHVMPRDNIFTWMIAALYQADTATNLWPSIHVYNSLGAHLAISHSRYFADKRIVRKGSLLLAVSIILSTMLIKQHSVFDVLTAFVMALVMYLVVYRFDILYMVRDVRTRNKKKPKPQVN